MLVTTVVVCIALFAIHIITGMPHEHLGDVGVHELSLMINTACASVFG